MLATEREKLPLGYISIMFGLFSDGLLYCY